MTGSHISLFSGVGMTDLAAEAAGFKTLATAEVDPFCRSVLRRRFPYARHYTDVREVTRSAAGATRRPLLVSGGFPCQDVAAPGTGLGLNGARSGMYRELIRVVREFTPDAVLIENVALLRKRGLNHVLSDLARLGYDARWDCLPAAMFGAPHLRDRIYIVAWKAHEGVSTYFPSELPRAGLVRRGLRWERAPICPVALAKRVPSSTATALGSGKLWPTPTKSDGTGGPGTSPKRTGGKNLRTAVAEQDGNGRLNPAWVEWLMGLPSGWTDPTLDTACLGVHHGWGHEPMTPRTVARARAVPDRSKRIQALGNGLLPQAAQKALTWLPDNVRP